MFAVGSIYLARSADATDCGIVTIVPVVLSK